MLIDFAHRRWLIGTTIAAALAAVAYVPYYRGAVNGPSGSSVVGLVYGIAAFACMLVAGLLGARRKVPTWRIGRAATWMKGHIWLGLLTLPLVLFHGGFAFGGPLTTVLMILLLAVLASGIYGLVLQQFLPRVMMTQVPHETVYEEIDSVVSQLRDEADGLIATACGTSAGDSAPAAEERRAGGGIGAAPRPTARPRPAVVAPLPGADALKDIYEGDIRAFLSPQLPRDGRLSTPARAEALFRHIRTALPPPLHDTVMQLEGICEERRELAQQKRLHHWLHGWLLFHVPLSLALLLLSAAHAVLALRY